MSARFFVDLPLQAAQRVELPADAARHVQVLRMQPGDDLTLFNGQGGEWRAIVQSMGRRDVQVQIESFLAGDRELRLPVLLAVGMPANERFDWLIEKATELGALGVQPLLCERSVVRLDGERSERKRAHWQGVARAAAEQCGRTRVPTIATPCKLSEFLRAQTLVVDQRRWVLSLAAEARPLASLLTQLTPAAAVVLLSGPEGGLSPQEEQLAGAAGFQPISLGSRVLRSETAPLAALACLGLMG